MDGGRSNMSLALNPKKRFLLISPNHQFPKSKGNLSRLNIGINITPFDLGYIGTQLKHKGCPVKLIFANRYNLSLIEVEKEFDDFMPDIVGITSSSGYICPAPSIQPTVDIIKLIRRKSNYIKIIVVGGLASLFEKILLETGADVVIRKEPELKFIEVLDSFNNLGLVKGVSYRNNGCIFQNDDDDQMVNMDLLPPIDYHLFNADHLRIEMNPMVPDYLLPAKKIVILETNRGCPYRCVFCYQYHRGHRVRHKNIDRVIQEIQYYKSEFGINLFQIPDNNFTINRKYVVNLCERIKQLPFRIYWRAVTRPDCVDTDLLKKMKEAGCYYIAFGFETADNEILRRSKKKYLMEDVEKSVLMCKKVGITVGLFSLYFLPGETAESIKKTIKFAAKLKPLWIGANVATPIPGTELYKMGLMEGKIKGEKGRLLEECTDVAGSIGNNFTSEEANKLYKRIRRKLLFINLTLNPFYTLQYTIKSMKNIKGFFQFGKEYFGEFLYAVFRR